MALCLIRDQCPNGPHNGTERGRARATTRIVAFPTGVGVGGGQDHQDKDKDAAGADLPLSRYLCVSQCVSVSESVDNVSARTPTDTQNAHGTSGLHCCRVVMLYFTHRPQSRLIPLLVVELESPCSADCKTEWNRIGLRPPTPAL
jgi:hypothetical protein